MHRSQWLISTQVFERAAERVERDTGVKVACPAKLDELWAAACRGGPRGFIRKQYNRTCPEKKRKKRRPTPVDG